MEPRVDPALSQSHHVSLESYYSHTREEMLTYVPEGAKEVLDVGCGSGGFGELLQRKRGCRVTGVEPSAAAHAIAATKLHAAVLDSVESFLASCEGVFDVICFNDVLEHLIDPWQQLRACHRILRPGQGIVVASVPNIRYCFALRQILLAGDFPYQQAGIFDRTHLRFFTRKSLLRMFSDCGFSVLRCEGINGLRSGRYAWANRLTLRRFEDMIFPQFAIVARLNPRGAKMDVIEPPRHVD